jgi:hypothetical protein
MADVVIPYRFRVKRDTAAAFTAANTLLLSGEIGLETDTRRYKIGDGTTAWNSLPYSSAATIADTRRILDLLGSTAEGDIIYKGPSGWTRLAKDADGKILKLASGLPAWANESGGGGGGSGAMEHVATVNVTGSAVSSVSVTGLDLAADGAYMVLVGFANPAGSLSAYRLFYNSDTALSSYYRQSLASNHTSNNSARGNVADILEAEASAGVMATIWIATDGSGRARAVAHASRHNPSSIIMQLMAHAWTTVDNVTSLQLASSVANAIGVGSYMRVYKVAK